MGACAVCGETFADDELLFGDRGQTCAMCVVEADEAVADRQQMWTDIVGPPVLGVASWLAVCVPFVGILVAPVVAAAALATGLNAVRKGIERRHDDDAENLPMMLIVGGSVACVLGLGTFAMVAMAGLGLLVALVSQ